MDSVQGPVARIVELRTGRVGALDRASVGSSGTVPSALGKRPRSGPVLLGEQGFDGDVQADRTTHGGPQKAVLVYPAEHYPWWSRELGFDIAERGLGENLRVQGRCGAADSASGAAWDERAVRPGDVYRIGTAVVRVTAPRRPCYKLGLAHGIRDMPVRVQRTGRTGFYLATVETGTVRAGDAVELLERAPHEVTVYEVNRVMNVDKHDADAIARVLGARRFLPPHWAAKLDGRLERIGGGARAAPAAEDDERLYG